MSRDLTPQESRYLANFEQQHASKRLPLEAQSDYGKLSSSSKLIFARNITDQLSRVDEEEWRGTAGQDEARLRILEDHAPLALKDILVHQEASESWIRRMSEEKLQAYTKED